MSIDLNEKQVLKNHIYDLEIMFKDGKSRILKYGPFVLDNLMELEVIFEKIVEKFRRSMGVYPWNELKDKSRNKITEYAYALAEQELRENQNNKKQYTKVTADDAKKFWTGEKRPLVKDLSSITSFIFKERTSFIKLVFEPYNEIAWDETEGKKIISAFNSPQLQDLYEMVVEVNKIGGVGDFLEQLGLKTSVKTFLTGLINTILGTNSKG